MAPELIPFEYDPSPAGFPTLLRRVWRWLYPQGEDPVFQVYREKLADFVHEYRAEVFLHTDSMVGSLTRSAKGGAASTPEQAVSFASMAALVELRHQEVGMQNHPGLSHFPTLTSSGHIMFPPDSAYDRPDVHLSRYVVAQYELIVSLVEELATSREALVSLSVANSPPPHLLHRPQHQFHPLLSPWRHLLCSTVFRWPLDMRPQGSGPRWLPPQLLLCFVLTPLLLPRRGLLVSAVSLVPLLAVHSSRLVAPPRTPPTAEHEEAEQEGVICIFM